MARFAAAGRATIAGTSTLPLVSLYATATVRPRIAEIHAFNTTSTAVNIAVVRLSSTGTQGAALTAQAESFPEHPALGTPRAGHTVAPTIVTGPVRQATLGAAVGSGVMWSFGLMGLEIQAATTNGVGIIVPNGTGQILDYAIVWDE